MVFRNLLLGGTEKTVSSTAIKFSSIVVSTVADLLGLLLDSFEHFSIFILFFSDAPQKLFFQIRTQGKTYAGSEIYAKTYRGEL